MATTKPEAKKPEIDAPSVAASVAPSDEFPMTLEQFCTQISNDDKRVELIGGFFYNETRAGRNKDTASNFMKRLDEFANAPA